MEDKKSKFKNGILSIITIILLTIIDQVIKMVILANFEVGENLPIIKGVFEIEYVRNTGTAWSILSGKTFFLVLISFVIVAFVGYLYHNIMNYHRYHSIRIFLTILLGGALGNLIDRIRLHYVVDYLYFSLINFPVFNFADICITLSIIVLVILLIFKFNHDDFDVLFGDKRLDENGEYISKKSNKSKKSNNSENA